MPRTPSLVYVGLDAVDRNLVRDLCAAGRLPAIASLLGGSVQAPTRNHSGAYVGSLWRTVSSGQLPGRHARHNWAQITLGTHRLTKEDLRVPTASPPFWSQLLQQGHHVAAVDFPLTGVFPVPGADAGLQVSGVESHDWRGLPMVEPSGAVTPDVAARQTVDSDEWAAQGRHAELVGRLLDNVATKRAVLHGALDEGPEALLTVCGSGHAVGHQCWHLHDAGHVKHDPAWAARHGGDPVLRVYEALDELVGSVVERAGDATVLLHLSHGMDRHYDGSHLLPAISAAIDEELLGGAGPVGAATGRALQSVRYHGRLALGRVGVDVRPRTMRWFDTSRKVEAVPNNACNGALRLNVRGREPRGRVAADDVPRVLGQVDRALRSLVHTDSGEPVVADVIHRREAFPGPRSEELPDLFVIWRRDRPVTSVKAPWLSQPITQAYGGHRTGDHRLRGLLAARPPRPTAAREIDPVPVVDIAPTLAAVLGTELRDVDGTPALALLGR